MNDAGMTTTEHLRDIAEDLEGGSKGFKILDLPGYAKQLRLIADEIDADEKQRQE